MKGDKSIIDALNNLLIDELTAINQYMVHAEMCANWGYERLHKAVEKRSMQEMKHAENLIARILFLEGKPTVSKLNEIHIGADVETQIKNDLASEANARKLYNEGIQHCWSKGDTGSRELLESNLKDEEDHIDWLEAQLDQMKQMKIETYLGEQTS
jgi:bacterioferritin